jgi:hypothetical protein
VWAGAAKSMQMNLTIDVDRQKHNDTSSKRRTIRTRLHTEKSIRIFPAMLFSLPEQGCPQECVIAKQ